MGRSGGSMPWQKAPQSLVELFDEVLPDSPLVERRKMFGYPAAFVGGHLFAGVFQDRMFARLPDDVRARLEAAHGPTPLEPMPGRPMKAYAVFPDAVMVDEAALAELLASALAGAAAMPPKEKPAKARRAKG